MAELAGEKEAGRYFKEMDENALAQFAQQQAAGAQQQKQEAIQTQLTLEQGKAQARAQGQAQAAAAGAQARAQGHVAATPGPAQQTDVHKAQIQADMQAQIARLEASLEELKLQHQHALKMSELGIEAQLERVKMKNRDRSGQGNLPEVTG
jgi:hypothetical protein